MITCKYPYIRDPYGSLKSFSQATEEEKLSHTPFPCGQCLPCRIRKAREWKARIILESYSHKNSIFVTLTYNEENNPVSLNPRHLTLFLKRFRKKVSKFRYFAVGEYGEKSWRPHFHIIFFGLDSSVEVAIGSSWNYGFYHIGDLNEKSAGYISGYAVKKMTKKGDPRLMGLHPEFFRSSRQEGGLGKKTVVEMKKKLDKNNIDDVISSVRIGKKKFGLGKYLSDIVNKGKEVQKKERLKDYQNEIFLLSNTGNLILDISNEISHDLRVIEKKSKIYYKKDKVI